MDLKDLIKQNEQKLTEIQIKFEAIKTDTEVQKRLIEELKKLDLNGNNLNNEKLQITGQKTSFAISGTRKKLFDFFQENPEKSFRVKDLRHFSQISESYVRQTLSIFEKLNLLSQPERGFYQYNSENNYEIEVKKPSDSRSQVFDFIKNLKQQFTPQQIYKHFKKSFSKTTVKQVIKRLEFENEIIRIKRGTYKYKNNLNKEKTESIAKFEPAEIPERRTTQAKDNQKRLLKILREDQNTFYKAKDIAILTDLNLKTVYNLLPDLISAGFIIKKKTMYKYNISETKLIENKNGLLIHA